MRLDICDFCGATIKERVTNKYQVFEEGVNVPVIYDACKDCADKANELLLGLVDIPEVIEVRTKEEEEVTDERN